MFLMLFVTATIATVAAAVDVVGAFDDVCSVGGCCSGGIIVRGRRLDLYSGQAIGVYNRGANADAASRGDVTAFSLATGKGGEG